MRISDWSSDVCSSDLAYGDAGISPETTEPPSVPAVEWAPPTRYCDQPMDWRTRLVGLGGTTAVLALVAAVGMLGWQVAESVIISPSPPVVVNLRSFEAPPEPVREVPEGPEKAERQEAKRSEEHTSELQSLMRISYAVFC